MKYRLEKSKRKNKQMVAIFTYKGKEQRVHFGDSKMKEYPGTKRGDNYCARSYGILDGDGKPTRNNVLSPNFWSRNILWKCVGKRSER